MSAGHHIYILDRITVDPQKASSERVELDLPEDFGFQIGRSVSSLSANNNIKQDGVYPVRLPASHRNRVILEKFRSLNVRGNTYQPFQVEVWVWGYQIPVGLLRGIRYEGGKEFFCELASTDNWQTRAESLKLNSLDLGTFTFSVANIEASWDANPSWQDGDDTVIFPLIHYGRFDRLDGSAVSHEYFRPLHNLLAVMRAGFCELGWEFKCPFLETDTGRSIWTYLLAKDFYNRGGNGDSYKFTAEYDQGSDDWSVSSSGSLFAGITNYPASTTFSFLDPIKKPYQICFNGSITNPTGVSVTVNWRIYTEYNTVNGPVDPTLFYSEDIVILPGQTVNVDMCAPATSTAPLDNGLSFFVEFLTNNPTVFPDDGFVVTGQPYMITLIIDEEITLGDLINPDYKFLQLVKGVLHLGNFRVYEDLAKRRISFLLPEDRQLDGVTMEGYYKKEIIDVTDRVLNRSINASYPADRQNRYLSLQFKSSNDDFVRSLNLPDDEPLHSLTIDFVDAQDPDGVDVLENPFFEPTAETVAYEMLTFDTAVRIPAMFDNEGGNYSFDIGPRILYCHGRDKQYNPSGEIQLKWVLNIDSTGNQLQKSTILYVTQETDILWTDSKLPIEKKLTYAGDLYTYGWKSNTDAIELGVAFQLDLLFKNIEDAIKPDLFRYRFSFLFDGETVITRLSNFKEWNTAKQGPATAALVQDVKSNEC